MEKLGGVYKLLDEYSNHQIDLNVSNKVSNLLEQRGEYNNDLNEEKKRSEIDTKIAENFNIRGFIDKILDYLENNEDKLIYDIAFIDLNDELRKVINFISENNDKFNTRGLYLNYFANIINRITNERLTRLGSIREYYTKKLLTKGINISKESFYLRIKNEVFDLINELNFDYIYGIKNETQINKRVLNGGGDEKEINNENGKFIFELIDLLYENKEIELGDIKKYYFREEFEYIKKFLFVNEENINLLMKNSIYFMHFIKIITLMDNGGSETMSDISKYLEEDLNENTYDSVSINKGYYEEMKEEMYDLINDLNNLLIIHKTT